MVNILLENFVEYIDRNYHDLFQIMTISDYILEPNYIENFTPTFYRFLKQEEVPYDVFVSIDKNKFIELALARNIEVNE